MNWASFCLGLALGGLITLWIAAALGRRLTDDLRWERDQAIEGMNACLKRMREDGVPVRRTDTIGEIQDRAGL